MLESTAGYPAARSKMHCSPLSERLFEIERTMRAGGPPSFETASRPVSVV